MLFLGVLVLASSASAGEANLTRFGPKVYERGQAAPTSDSAEFRAIDGPATLVLQDDGIINARIKVNGLDVVGPENFRGNGKIVVPLRLHPKNTIEVSVRGKPGGRLGVRVTQFTQTALNVKALVYFGINTSSMVDQRVFYNTLGLTGEIFPAGPESCKSFAQSLGFEDNYLIYVALTSLTGAPPWVDTVQFRQDSFRADPPYAKLNHIGMTYATYATSDLDGDYAYLKGQGVRFVSAPASAPDGVRFAFLKDQDGTFLKLVEDSAGAAPNSSATKLTRLVNVNMNVADLERSREFYRLLGFTRSAPNSQAGSGSFAKAHGFDGPIKFQGMDVSLPGSDGTFAVGDPNGTLQLRQWKTPFDAAPPYSPPVNHLGIDRISFFVSDLNAAVDEMNRLGFQQLGPIGGGAGGVGNIAIAFFFDPDGNNVELWGPISQPNPNSGC
jgi:catechol 2,3-dioxygenase-like lactoylglutathione lyase family enzyme